MQHFDEGTIHAWLDGALPADEQTLIEIHVRECAECAALVAEARGMIAGATRIVSALDGVPAGVIPKRPAPVARRTVWQSLRLTPLRAGLAASLMIATASVFVIRRGPAAAVPEVERAEVAPTVAPVSAPAPVTVASSEPTRSAAKRSPTTKAAGAIAAAPSRAAEDTVHVAMTQPASVAPRAANEVAEPTAKVADARAREAAPAAREDSSRVEPAVVAASARNAFAPSAGARPALFDAVAEQPEAAARLFAGCYRVARDSSALFADIPEHFALDRVGTAPSVRNVVRAVNPNGVMDSTLPSATWELRARGAVTVSWKGRGDSELLHLTALPGGQVSGVAAFGSQAKPLVVTKVICAR
jgi:hypothetical protein